LSDHVVLTLWTSDPRTARTADAAGVDRIGVDLDRLGKAERQVGLGSWISPHTVDDLRRLRPVVARGRLLARVNPVHDGTATEVEAVLAAGATVLMLPMFRSARDVGRFVELVAGRARVVGLLETREALADVAALQRRSFTNAWGAEAIQWELDHTDVARLYAAHIVGRLVGYCACWIVFDVLHINSLAIDDGWRRRGVARALLTHVFRDAFDAGARMATLEVRQSNVAARHLYERLGFTVEGVRRNYYQDPREDGLILWHRRLEDFVGH
jgi:ribosomal-protein-alanine acetyltransferase